MITSARQPMQRKQIPMPSAMIVKVERIAKARKVSFAEIVRQAFDALDEDLAPEEAGILEAMMDGWVESTKDTIRRVDTLVERLDKTHAIAATAGRTQ